MKWPINQFLLSRGRRTMVFYLFEGPQNHWVSGCFSIQLHSTAAILFCAKVFERYQIAAVMELPCYIPYFLAFLLIVLRFPLISLVFFCSSRIFFHVPLFLACSFHLPFMFLSFPCHVLSFPFMPFILVFPFHGFDLFLSPFILIECRSLSFPFPYLPIMFILFSLCQSWEPKQNKTAPSDCSESALKRLWKGL